MSDDKEIGDKHNEAKEALNSPGNDSDALESVLSYIGEMGRYQKLLFVAMLPFGFFFAFVYFVQMFIAATPQGHWCKVPELEHLSLEMRRNLSAPPSSGSWEWERCFTYDVNWTQVLQTMMPPSNDTPLIPCQHGWVFDFTDIPYPTIVTEREWVCDKASYAPTAQAMFFVGALLGGVLFGWVADSFGRIPALIGCNLAGAVGGIATIFTTDVWDYTLCRFIVGMCFDNVFMMMYILVLEYVGARYRTMVANMSIALFFGAGAISLPWIALALKDWRMLIWVTSMPMFLVILVPFIVPESARWLLTRGKVNEAVAVLRKFEKINNTKVPDDVMDEFIVSASRSKQNKEERESLLVLMKNPPLRITMILMVLVYMVCALIFDGLVRMSDAFGLDFFLQFTLTSATEVPSITLLALVLDRWGRRNLTIAPLTISSVLILITMFVPKGVPQAVLAITARFFINMCYNAVLQWVTELLPTPVRASGSSTMHMSGYAAAIMSPYIVFSERFWSPLPLLVFGMIGLAGAGITLMLPETNGRPMPQTMADGEKIVREGILCAKPAEGEDMEWELKNNKSIIT